MLIDSQSGFLSLKLIDKLTTLTEKTATVLHIPSQSSYKVHTHTHRRAHTYNCSHTHGCIHIFKIIHTAQSNAQCLVPIPWHSKQNILLG